MTIPPKTPAELETMREGGKLLTQVLEATNDLVKPGVSLKAIDQSIYDQITQLGAEPSFLGYHNYPASSCLSVNEVVVHGIPTDYTLKEGDVLGIDIGVLYGGYHTDAAFTKALGSVRPEVKQLLAVTQSALHEGIEAAKAGNVVGDIGQAIETYVTSQGKFGIIRDLTGHGVGRNLQEPPEIMNYATNDRTPLINGMTLAIEPMLSLGTWKVAILPDRWTIVTRDKSLAAHFETTIVIRDNDPEVLIPFPLSFPVDAT